MNLTKPQKQLAASRPEKAMALLPPIGTSSDPRIEIIRARVLADSDQLPQAIEVLRQNTERFPNHAPSHVFTGTFLWDNKSPNEAMTSFDQVLALQKNNDLARSYRALCLCALNDHTAAAAIWREHGFSDNAMFRVRTAEHIETSWLLDQTYWHPVPEVENPTEPTRISKRAALREFYRRHYADILKYVPSAPTDDELQTFLAATAHEMLRQYDAAAKYIEPFLTRREEWPEPLIALNARLMVRRGEIASAASELATIVIMGPEDFAVNYYMAVISLAYEKPAEARQYFIRAFTDYMVDTLEFQWWQIEQTLLNPKVTDAPTPA